MNFLLLFSILLLTWSAASGQSRISVGDIDWTNGRAQFTRDSIELQFEESKIMRIYPLVPYVFFDKDSLSIPKRYHHWSQPEERMGFDDEQLSNTALGAHYHILNVVGYRLQKFPDAALRLVAWYGRSDAGAKSKAKVRAGVVHDYMQQIWGIDANRMKVELRTFDDRKMSGEAKDEYRRVELISNRWEIMKLVLNFTTVWMMEYDSLKIRFRVEGVSGDNHKLLILRNNRLVAALVRDATDPSCFTWDNREYILQKDRPVSRSYSIRLVETDEQGIQRIVDSLELPVSVSRYGSTPCGIRRYDHDASTKELYPVVLFRDDDPDLKLIHNRYLTDYVEPRIYPSSVVTLASYDSSRQQKRHLTSIEKQLYKIAKRKHKPFTIRFENDALPFSHETPEGRMLNRAVYIRIQTPFEELE